MRDLVRGVLRITTAVVEEITDVMRLENLDKTLVFSAILVETLQLITAGTECTCGCVTQSRYIGVAFHGGIDEFFLKGADDAVAACKYFPKTLLFSCRFDHTARRCIDYSSHTAGLGVKNVVVGFRGHHEHSLGLMTPFY